MRALPALTLTTLILATGCSMAPTAPAQLDCTTLQSVVDQADSGFSGIVQNAKLNKLVERWDTDVQAYGSNCYLVSQSDAPRAYICSAESTQQAEDQRLLVEAVGACLGSQWSTVPAPRGGTRYIRSGSGVNVTVAVSDAQASRVSSVGLVVRQHPAP